MGLNSGGIDRPAAERLMRQALRLARRGRSRTWPNPMVGALVVSRGRVIGQGYHHRAGEAHAEVLALKDAGGGARGAELLVTLEPCHCHGRTPPCTDAIVAAGIKRVWVGSCDPNPRECGASAAVLRQAGVEVVEGVLEPECRELNEAYNVFMPERRPFVVAKAAVSLDGRLAARSGDSRWISSPTARRWAHALRGRSNAVLVGVGTVLSDDPLLTVRHVRGRNPVAVVLDSRLRTPPGARLLQTIGQRPVILFAGPKAPLTRERRLAAAGGQVVRVPLAADRLDLSRVLDHLFRRGIYQLLVEGGSRTMGSFVARKLVDRLELIVAGLLLGRDGLPFANFQGPDRVGDAIGMKLLRCRRLGEDVHLSAVPDRKAGGGA